MFSKAIFFDRDGVVTKNINGYAPKTLDELEIIPGIIPVIKKSSGLGFKIVIISNQPDISLGKINEQTQKKLEKKFKQLVKLHDLPVDLIEYCYHHPKAIDPKNRVCNCRKPKPGMLKKAARKLNINLQKSILIGDRVTDVEAGQTAGVTTIFYDNIDTKPQQKMKFKNLKIPPNFIFGNLKNLNKQLTIILKDLQ